jgi:hypothetical protein
VLTEPKRIYALKEWTVQKLPKGWYFRHTYGDENWHGPYASEFSVCLMIARHLRRELLRRDGVFVQEDTP